MTTLALVKADAGPSDDLPPFSEGEASALGRRVGQELLQMGAYYAREGQAGILGDRAARAQEIPPALVSWRELSALFDADPDKGAALWEAIKAKARDELAGGEAALRVIEATIETPMDRARFLVTHRAFVEEWHPCGGIEAGLIDQMAQAHALQGYWTRKATERACTSAAQDLAAQREAVKKEDRLWRHGDWVPPRVSDAEAIDTATAMADRWNRVLVRTLRQLRDLRRYTPVVVQNVGQMNVGGQQVNVAPPLNGTPPRKQVKRRTNRHE